jgi:hypothetical protein
MSQYINPKLKPFFDTIKPLEWKNQGGCLFFAYAFWLWAEKEGIDHTSFQIIQLDGNGGHDLETNLNWINTKEGSCRSSQHFVWKYHRTAYDGQGKVDFNDWRYDEVDTLTGLRGKVCLIEEFCVKALKDGGWNRMFNREEAIEHCEESLGIDLDKLK